MKRNFFILLKTIVLSVGLFMLMANEALAQKGIDTLSFIIQKGFQPTIADAVKLNDQPSFKDTTKKIPALSYAITSQKVKTVFHTEPIAPAVMVGEPLTKLYKSLIKAGVGNYNTPYAEFFYNNLRSRESSYGVHLKHLSSQATLKDVGFGGYSDNNVSIYGQKFINRQTITGALDYDRNALHRYGYDITSYNISEEATLQIFNHVTPFARIKSHYTDSSKINHDIGMKYYFFGDAHNSNESNFQADGIFTTYYDKQLLTLGTYFDYYNNRTVLDTTNNVIVKLNPSITAAGEKWTAKLGLSAFIDVSDAATQFKFYPHIDFNYHIIDNIFIPYAGVTGGLEKNSFRNYFLQNPFISSTIDLSKNSDNTFQLYGGIRGSLSSKTFYNAKASFSKVKGLPLFVNDQSTILGNSFTVIYDTATVFKVMGELGYQQTEKIRFLIKGEFNDYKLNNEAHAWHKPAWQITFSSNYNLRDKIVVKADVFYVGKRYARDYERTTILDDTGYIVNELKGFTDINLGVEYRYTKKLSGFLNLNNIGAARFYKWNNYPSQRFNMMLGLTFAF